MTKPDPSPLEFILGEIERALEAGFFYLAIAVSLTIPDICSGLEGTAWLNEKSYVKWWDENLKGRFARLTAIDAYRLRGGVVHRGDFSGHEKIQYNKVFFTLPDGRGNVMSEGTFKYADYIAFNLDALSFCKEMIDSARRWYETHKDDEKIKANMEDLVRFRPEGLRPFVLGLPVIA